MPHFHVLGAGAIGLLLAAQLRSAGHSCTLMLRDSAALAAFRAAGSKITQLKGQEAQPQQVSLDAVSLQDMQAGPGLGSTITNLLITTKAPSVLPALLHAAPLLAAQGASLVLLQNGLPAVYEEVHQGLAASARGLSLYVGSVTHGCFRTPNAPFAFTWAGVGSVQLARLDPNLPTLAHPGHAQLWPSHGEQPHQASPLLTALLECPDLNAQLLPSHRALVHAAMGKLAINCAINPLTALLRCPNGATARLPSTQALLNPLVSELWAVLGKEQALGCSEAQLLERVLDVARATADNRSSMLQDVEAGRGTEVEYLNGYVARLAAQGGVAAPTSECLYRLVQAAEALASGR